MNVSYRKRPCRVCGKWRQPSSRGGHHQKTCGQEECRKAWHRKKCRQWRKENWADQIEDRARRHLEKVQKALEIGKGEGKRAGMRLAYPRELGKEVMGPEMSVFIEVALQVVLYGTRAINRMQVAVKRGVPP